jgi:hypothetical protein
MRMLVRIQVPTADGNRAIQDGSLPAVLEKAMQELEPEAAYFVAEDGKRTFYWNATVQTTPAMTFEDVQTGLEKAFG